MSEGGPVDERPAASDGPGSSRGPRNHRTVDRVTQIVEEVVYRPGITFGELARALDAPKSSVHGFMRGLLARGWLYEDDHKFFLGPAIYGLTLASGQMHAGSVSQEDLEAVHEATGAAVFLGILAGEQLIYIGMAGTDAQTGFAARTNIRRNPLATAGGKALLAEHPDQQRDAYLRRRPPEDGELVSRFLGSLPEIKRTGVADNVLHDGAQYALATVVRNQFGEPAAAITLVGPADDMLPRKEQLRATLATHVERLTAYAARRTAG